jgi:flagellar protein FlaF
MSIQAYQRAQTQGDSPRELEYRAFGMATARLVRAQEAGRSALGELSEALAFNRQLWTALSADCALPENQLPDVVRATIISLAIWVRRYSRDVLRGEADIEDLIKVNRDMMEGLAPR